MKVAGGATAVTLVGGGLVVSGQPVTAAEFTASNEAELAQAITTANGTVGVADTITIAAGTITLTGALPAITDELTIVGAGTGDTLLDGAGSYRVLAAIGAGSLTVENLTIQNGSVGLGSGGAVAAYATSLTITDVVISGNFASDYGGAVYVLTGAQATVSVDVTDSTFTQNDADSRGGAISVTGYSVSLSITGSTFDQNSSGSNGGAVAVWKRKDFVTGATVSIVDSTFSYNEADGGGAVYVDSELGSVTITGSDFTGNTASSSGGGAVNISGYMTVDIDASEFTANYSASHGGALYLGDPESVTIDESDFDDNTAIADGGAMNVYEVESLVVSDSSFSSNSAANGGAIYFDGSQASSLTIENSTFDGNSASYEGGAIESFNASVVIDQSTISGNTANYTGAVHLYVKGGQSVVIQNSTIAGNTSTTDGVGGVSVYGVSAGDVDIVNSVIADNVGASAPVVTGVGAASVVQDDLELDLASATVAISHSLIGSTAVDLTAVGTSNLTGVDPLLGDLADNGGRTETMLPQAGSPLIDAGDDSVASFDDDQRGGARVQGDAIDIGAVEVQDEAPPTTVPATTIPTTTVPIPAILPPTGGDTRTGVLAALVTGLGAVLTLGASRRRRSAD